MNDKVKLQSAVFLSPTVVDEHRPSVTTPA